MRVRLRGVSGPIQPRNHQGLFRPRYHPWPDKLALGLWPQPCDPSSRRSSASGAPDARCRVRGVLELVQWTNSALNGRRPSVDGRLAEGDDDLIDEGQDEPKPDEVSAPTLRRRPRVSDATLRERLELDPGTCCPDWGGDFRVATQARIIYHAPLVRWARMSETCLI
jgi:hypothetical protein